MCTQTCSCSRRIWLNRIALVEQSLVVYLLEKIPQSLNISVVVGDIRIIHVNPISDPFGHVHPLGSVFHDLLAAGLVVFLNRNLRSDILLGDSEHFLNAKLDRKSVGIPSGPSVDLVAALCLVTAD